MLGTTLENFPVASLAFSPNGSILAVGGGGFWNPGWLEFYDVITGQQITMLFPKCSFPCGGLSDVHEIAFNPDGTILASAHGDGIVRIWDVTNRNELRELADVQGSIAFSPDGKMLMTRSSWSEGESSTEQDFGGGIQFWDVQTWKMLKLFDVGVESIRSIAISPNGKILAVVHDRSVDLWDMVSGERLARIDCGDQPVISFSPDGSGLAIGDSYGVIHLWVMPAD
jgi:WD40 repeat protein